MTEENKSPEDLNDKKEEDTERKHQEECEEMSLSQLEFVDAIPPKVQSMLRVFMRGASSSVPNPLSSKITEKHIDKVLDLSAKEDERQYADTKSSRIFRLIYILVVFAFFAFLIIFLADKDKDLLKELIKYLGIFLGGLGAGYGVSNYRKKDS